MKSKMLFFYWVSLFACASVLGQANQNNEIERLYSKIQTLMGEGFNCLFIFFNLDFASADSMWIYFCFPQNSVSL